VGSTPGEYRCAGVQSRMQIEEHGGETTFLVRVTPRANRNTIEGLYQEALCVRARPLRLTIVQTRSVKRSLAECLNVPVSAARIVAGGKSPQWLTSKRSRPN
jgi:uncharacterized protein YggU (UPF0235/DUF167 family)